MSNFSERAAHYNEVSSGVLWNPKIFRRFLPIQFFNILTHESLKKCYEYFDWQPVEMRKVYIHDTTDFLKWIGNCNSHSSLTDSRYIATFRSFREEADELLSQLFRVTGPDNWSVMNKVTKCLSFGVTSDAWKYYEVHCREDLSYIEDFATHWLNLVADHGYFECLAARLFRLCCKYYFDWFSSQRTLIYDATTDSYYVVTPRRAGKYKPVNWDKIVAPEYVSLFSEIGDSTEYTDDPVTYWRRGLFYAYIDYAIYYEKKQFSDIVPNLTKIRDIQTVTDVWNIGASLMPDVEVYIRSFS